MKKLSYIFLAVLSLSYFSCEEDSDTLTGNESVGGLLENVTPAVTYATGSDPDDLMEASLSAFQGREKVQSVEVYNQYFGTVSGTSKVSNKVLLRTLTFPVVNEFESIDYEFSFNDLREGLSYNGATFPTTDATLEIGDYWQLTFLARLTDGTTTRLSRLDTKVRVACGSFLAGNYANPDANPSDTAVITSLGGGVYACSGMPFLTAGGNPVPFQFSDVCDEIIIDNIVLGSYLMKGSGVVNPNRSITITYILYNGGTEDTGIFFDFSATPSTYTPN